MGLILVISEDAVEIETIKAALSVHGWWVTVAGDRQAALQVAADQAPKLVVVDSGVNDSIELVRAFGASNGGPGVLVCAPEDIEGSLSLRQAGADEMLTKPVDAPRLLDAVQRCLTAPRQQQVERAPAHVDLLTSEEIFGDVLRELEEVDGPEAEEPALASSEAPPAVSEAPPQPVAAVAASPVPSMPPEPEPVVSSNPAPALSSTEAPAMPASVAAAALGDASTSAAATPDAKPVVSLAGLFDGAPMGDLPQAADPAIPTPPPAAEATADEDLDSLWGAEAKEADSDSDPDPDWQGAERRHADRPWSAPEAAATAASQPPAEPPAAELPEGLGERALEEPLVDLPLPTPADETQPAVAGEEVLDEEVAGSIGRLPRPALVIGAIAVIVLIVLGVIFLRNPGAEPADPASAPEPAQAAVAGTDGFSSEELGDAGAASAETDAEPVAEPVVGSTGPAAEPRSPAEPVVEPEQIEDLDLQAIVDQELERREDELRQVFLEEEKRLLRELGSIDSEQAAEDGEDGDGGEPGG